MASDLVPEEILAKHLGISESQIQTWSDGSLTVGEAEYTFKKRPIKWCNLLVKRDGYYIYKTQ